MKGVDPSCGGDVYPVPCNIAIAFVGKKKCRRQWSREEPQIVSTVVGHIPIENYGRIRIQVGVN